VAEEVRTKHPKVGAELAPKFCMDVMFQITLLEVGYGERNSIPEPAGPASDR
jgi:hypothetical protein